MGKKKVLMAAVAVWMCSTMAMPCVFAAERDSAKDATKGATKITAEVNRQAAKKADSFRGDEAACAAKNRVGEAEQPVIPKDHSGNSAAGTTAWDVTAYGFVKGAAAPDTVNPSLWHNTQLNAEAGVFEVLADRIYQVRGYDMANATFIRSEHGWLVFDTLMCTENMRAALQLMQKEVFPKFAAKENRIVAVLYSHPHVDHFGGICGLISAEDVYRPDNASESLAVQMENALQQKKTVIMAPDGFLREAESENVYAGKAMGRRAQYQYGVFLPKGARGGLSIGIGLGQSTGEVSLIAPTYNIAQDKETADIDGVSVKFQLTPDTEAPCEVNVWFPQWHALWLAENCTGTMHNIYTLRGAKVRDANGWAKYICEAMSDFGPEAQVVFQSHNWPHWGNQAIWDYMKNTAETYKYIHDQTLHYINLGYTSTEISHMLQLPGELDRLWYNRPYYGTVSHNAKAVYQKYMGWYDANPVNLNLLPPQDSAKKLVEYLGDTNAVLAKARKDFAKGNYQWVAQITKEIVYADPQNMEARRLCADALEQLGYQAESGTWRNAYLMGALELRQTPEEAAAKAKLAAASNAGGKGNMSASGQMTTEMALDYLGIITDASKAVGHNVTLRLTILDDTGKTAEEWVVKRENGTVVYFKGDNPFIAVDGQVSCTCRQFVDAILSGSIDGIPADHGNTLAAFAQLLDYREVGTGAFNIIEP